MHFLYNKLGYLNNNIQRAQKKFITELSLTQQPGCQKPSPAQRRNCRSTRPASP